MTLDEIEPGTRAFVDSTIFIYHFGGASEECRRFLERCERGEVKAVTSVLVLAEVAHRLMTIEALATGVVRAGNVTRKLREKPALIKKLHLYGEQVERIPLMGIDVLPVELKVLLRSHELRAQYGLLVNDSLVATTALEAGAPAMATSDSDFERVRGLELFMPSDL